MSILAWLVQLVHVRLLCFLFLLVSGSWVVVVAQEANEREIGRLQSHKAGHVDKPDTSRPRQQRIRESGRH